MQARTSQPPTLTDLLTSIIVIATRMLRDLHVHASNTSILKTILATHLAAARIGRAVRLATLLMRRIQIHGLLPLPPARPRSAPPSHAATPRTQVTPPLHTGNADAAFVRRPIAAIVAAITRELYLAAQIMDLPLPESLKTLCLRAAIATTGLDTPETPTPPQANAPASAQASAQATTPAPTASTHPHPSNSEPGNPERNPPPTPAPAKTLEL